MKVTLEERYREFYTLDDLDRAKAVIASEKDDFETAKGWAEMAVREALKGTDDGLKRIIEASARTARNGRISWDGFCDGSGNMDVWIEGLAETWDGFAKFGAYLSDIWQTGAIPYKHHMFIINYKRA